MLIYDKTKEHINKSREKQDVTSRKINYLFDMITSLEK